MTTVATLPKKPGLRENVIADILELLGGTSEDDMEIMRDRLKRREETQNQSEYHRVLLARVFPKPGHPIPELPEGKYESYEILKGLHYHNLNADVLLAREEHKKRCERAVQLNAPIPDFPTIIPTQYNTGSTVTPQDDAEALMMLQDADKFHPMRGGEQDRIATLLAEANAKETRIAELEAALAETKKNGQKK